jgi:hypothetical protein
MMAVVFVIVLLLIFAPGILMIPAALVYGASTAAGGLNGLDAALGFFLVLFALQVVFAVIAALHGRWRRWRGLDAA